MKKYDSDEEVLLFIERFIRKKDDHLNNHRSHLLIGLWFAFHFPFDIAINKTRGFMKTYHANHNNRYNETITHFWFSKIYHFTNDNYFTTIYDAANQLLQSPLIQSYLPEFHYESSTLNSKRSQKEWIMPDLDPIDKFFKKKLKWRDIKIENTDTYTERLKPKVIFFN